MKMRFRLHHKMGFRAWVLRKFLTQEEADAQDHVSQAVQLMENELSYRSMSRLGVHDGEKYNPLLALMTWYGSQSRSTEFRDYTDQELQEGIVNGKVALYTRSELRRTAEKIRLVRTQTRSDAILS